MAYSIDGALKNIKDRATTWITGKLPEDENSEKIIYTELGLDIVGEEILSMSSDTTDYYVEHNVAYQDQVSLKPTEYKITGEIGEVVYYKKDESNSILGAVPEKLTAVATFLPPTTKKVNELRNKAIKISNFVNSIDNIANRLGKLTDTENKQQIAVRTLQRLWLNRAPICVRTPFMSLIDYVITDLSFTQGNTVDKMTVSITLKELRLIYTTDRVIQNLLPEGQTRHEVQAKNSEEYSAGALGHKMGVEMSTLGKATGTPDWNIVPNNK